MLTFRRPAPHLPRTEPAPPRKAAAPQSNAEKARALMAMLERGGDPGAAGVTPERLRDWARDLVETVERRRRDAPQAIAAAEAPTSAPTRGGLFSAPPPRMEAAGPSAVPAPSPEARAVEPPPAPSAALAAARLAAAAAFKAAAPVAEAHAGLPVQHPHGAAAGREAPSLAMPRGALQKLVGATTDQQTIGLEHPAIVAMTLLGRAPLEQSALMRRLPGGQIRAVHRALRMLEEA